MDLLEDRYEEKNCMDFLKALPDNSKKLVEISPPNNVRKACENITSPEECLNKMEPIIKEHSRVLRENSTICWEVGNTEKKKKITTDAKASEKVANLKSKRYSILWGTYSWIVAIGKMFLSKRKIRVLWIALIGLLCLCAYFLYIQIACYAVYAVTKDGWKEIYRSVDESKAIEKWNYLNAHKEEDVGFYIYLDEYQGNSILPF